MGIIELLNTVVLVVGISSGLMMVSQTIIKVRNEEYRKNEELVTKLTDRILKSTKEMIVETFKELKKLDNDDKPTYYSGPKSMSDKIKEQIDSEFE